MYCRPHHQTRRGQNQCVVLHWTFVVARDHYLILIVALMLHLHPGFPITAGSLFSQLAYMTDQWVIINTSAMMAVGVA